MPEPVWRLNFGGADVVTEIAVIEGRATFYVDVIPANTDHSDQTVTIGWTPDRGGFGVWVNGVLVNEHEGELP